MGGNSNATVQPNANSLASLFGGSQGYQQQPAAPATQIQQPAYPMPSLTPQQAALATQARMQARNPLVPPAVQQQPANRIQRGGEGGGPRGASSGGNGNGWGGH